MTEIMFIAMQCLCVPQSGETGGPGPAPAPPPPRDGARQPGRGRLGGPLGRQAALQRGRRKHFRRSFHAEI